MADLASLMDVAPYAGVMMAGQQNQSQLMNDQMNRAHIQQQIQQLQQDYQQKMLSNPDELEKLRLGNQKTRQGFDETAQDIRTKSLANEKSQGTLTSDIAAGNSKSNLQMAKDQTDEIREFTKRIVGYKDAIQQWPEASRTGALLGAIQADGANLQGPAGKAMAQQLLKIPPKALPEFLNKLIEHQNQLADANYEQAKMTAKERSESSKYTADTHAKTEVQVHGMDNASRERVATIRKGTGAGGRDFWTGYDKLKEPGQRYGALMGEASKLIAEGDPDGLVQAQKMMKMAQALQPQVDANLNVKSRPTADLQSLNITPTQPLTVNPGGAASTPALAPASAAQKGQPNLATKSGTKFKIIN